jgi:phenylalanyl-tRNA synthetase beta chain
LGLGDGHLVREAINLVNPLNDTEGVMRTTLLPGLLKSAAIAVARKNDTAQLYEMGRVFLPGGGKLPEQPDRLAFLLAGETGSDWHVDAHGFDLYDGTGVWELLAEKLGLVNAELRQASVSPFHPGRCAEIVVDDAVIGTLGEIHPSVAEAFGLSGRVVAAELDLGELLLERAPWQFKEPSVFPPVVFDLAFAVPSSTAAATIVQAAESGAGDLVDGIEVFDVFVGDSVGEGLKSVAIRIHLRATDRTLTDEEVTPVRRMIVDSVVDASGGELRGKA